MPETADPHAALSNKAVSVRAAATRDLASSGGYGDLASLIDVATGDKSPSVRLYAAAAVTAILMRRRGAYGSERWKASERDPVLDRIGAVDPERTPSLLLAYAAFPELSVVKRLCRMTRDPRYSVRAGAVTALRRMALSGAAADEDPLVREWVGETLGNRKAPTDVATELVRLVGEAGWTPLRDAVRRRSDVAAEVTDEALSRLEAREDPASWSGVWLDEGRDVLSEDPVVRGGVVVLEDPPVEAGSVVGDGRRYRLIWAPRPATEGSHPAIQAEGRTWWRLEGKPLVGLINDDGDLASLAPQLEAIEPRLAELTSAPAIRARALLLARCGEGERALEVLRAPLSAKRPTNALFFVQGLALAATGDPAGARAAFERFLDKAKKTDPWRAEAERYVG